MVHGDKEERSPPAREEDSPGVVGSAGVPEARGGAERREPPQAEHSPESDAVTPHEADQALAFLEAEDVRELGERSSEMAQSSTGLRIDAH